MFGRRVWRSVRSWAFWEFSASSIILFNQINFINQKLRNQIVLLPTACTDLLSIIICRKTLPLHTLTKVKDRRVKFFLIFQFNNIETYLHNSCIIMQQMKDRQNLDTKFLGTPFDRQVRIQEWNQDLIQQQAVLLLGVGGLGSVAAINLLRLGVGKLFLVDYDVVDVHNLNRQLLYSHADVGIPKVEAALKNAQFHKAGNTEIQIFHGNALTNWQKIVNFAKQSTFVYNCIDWGDRFDMAVSSLCLKLGKPLVMGGTFSTSLTVDYFPAQGRPCYLCTQIITEAPEVSQRIKPDVIVDLTDISFLPKNNNPIGRSSVVVCTICGQLMISHFLNWLFLSEQKPYKASRLLFYHNTFEIVKFELERFKKCPFCAPPEDFIQPQPQVEEKPAEISVNQQKQLLEATSKVQNQDTTNPNSNTNTNSEDVSSNITNIEEAKQEKKSDKIQETVQ